MADILIRPYEHRDLSFATALWNALCESGEMIYSPMSQEEFAAKFVTDEATLLMAEVEGAPTGFIHGVISKVYLQGKDAKQAPAYLTCVCVAPALRGMGVGHKLMEALRASFVAAGKTTMACSGNNPVHLAWRIPNTPGHDHNNAPGVDEHCKGAGFLLHEGMQVTVREIAMYRALKDYTLPEGIRQKRAELAAEGIVTGRYDVTMDCEFDGMCDRVGSEYWRSSIREEIKAWQTGVPNTVSEFWADGIRPSHPRPLLTATKDGHMIGFTGPVDKQKSGRGWFTGICTDPLWGGRGIATVLFGLLLEEFVKEGAAFTTLFTGVSNHAQKIYKRAGLQVVRSFAVLAQPLTADAATSQDRKA